MSELDHVIAALRRGDTPPEDEVHWICGLVQDLSIEEPNVVTVFAPVVIAGDVHGQLEDTSFSLLPAGGDPPDTAWLFLGDMVDRGTCSLETVILLLALKARYPDRITLLRGNHESRSITQVYGFYDEVVRKYGHARPWKWCMETFDMLPIAAVVENDIFCVHGGIAKEAMELDKIKLLYRYQEEGSMCDLLWSDPENISDEWQPSPRGAGSLYGETSVAKFHFINNLTLIARAHQLIMTGYQWMFNKTLITVWSAPNYCYRCGNDACVLAIGENTKERHVHMFEPAIQSEKYRKAASRAIPLYFL